MPENLGSKEKRETVSSASQARQAGLEPTTLGLEGRSNFVQPFAPPHNCYVLPSDDGGGQSRLSQPAAMVCKKFVPGLSPGLRVVAGGADYLLNVRDVAARLGVCTATVYALCDRGELPHIRISNAIRIAPRDLEEFLDRQRKGFDERWE